MHKNRNNSGFTMAEMLIVVALMAIIMAVAFIAVQNYQRSMKQLELDKTAREIYIAAQNHLTMAKSMGRLDNFAQTAADATDAQKEANAQAVGVQKTYEYTSDDGKNETRLVNFFVVAPDKESGTADDKLSGNTVLSEMLPEFSIDDKVRTGGSYIIEYDLGSAKVQSVFYCDLSDLSKHWFTDSDIPNLYPAYCGTSSQQSTKRRDGYGDNKAILGWYGGDDLEGVEYAQLYAPVVEVINAERLEVKVKLTTTAINRMSRLDDVNAVVKVFMEGVTSGANKQVKEYKLSELNQVEVVGTDSFRWESIILDDVTTREKHFCQTSIVESGKTPFIPGEDIKLYAEVESKSRLANVAQSTPKTTNSLFHSVSPEPGEKTVTIRNFRHLENLDQAISGYDLDDFKLKKAEQGNNLTWSDFMNKTNGDSTQIIPLTGTASKVKTYLPVNLPSGFESYDGKGLYIDGVNIDTTGNAGLFTTLNACSVSNLELYNFNVKTSSGPAGTLAGSATSANISGVKALNNQSDDSTKEIVATGSAATDVAGGLIGSVSGGTIDLSSASLYVRSKGSSAAAGGLVGTATGATIKRSYSAGHTTNGLYGTDTYPETDNPQAGRLNVQATGASGGLVGKTSGTTSITQCYSTCSAYGSTVGGLVGQTDGGSISTCYVTGYVQGTGDSATVGTFVGTLSNGTNLGTDNKYFSLVNMYDSTGAAREVATIGSDPNNTAVAAFDTSTNDYNAYVNGTATAIPYDTYLKQKSNGKYPFKGIKDLAAGTEGLPDGDIDHVGDWPMLETMLLNTKSST